jgi:hypothetical protein
MPEVLVNSLIAAEPLVTQILAITVKLIVKTMCDYAKPFAALFGFCRASGERSRLEQPLRLWALASLQRFPFLEFASAANFRDIVRRFFTGIL